MQLTWTIENDMTIPLETIKPRLTPLLPHMQELIQHIVASGKYVYGSLTSQLEAQLKDTWHISGRVILTKSGTDALTLAAWAAGIDDGIGANSEQAPIEVICPNLTFPSSATALTMAGLLRRNCYRIVFVDVHPRSLNVDPDAITAAITEHTRAVVVPHLYGNPAAMSAIMEIARTSHLKVIEDTSQAHGARCAGWFVGTMGNVAAGSLYAYKNLGAFGDLGYVIVPDDASCHQALRDRDLGRDMGERDMFHSLGLRTRPEEVNAGVALLQLPYLERKNARSRQIVAYYQERLLDTPIQMPTVEEDDEPTGWRCALLLPSQEVRSALRKHLADQGIGSEIVYPFPVSEHGAYQNGTGEYACRLATGGTPHAYDTASRVLCIPSWPQLSDMQVERIVSAVSAFFAQGKGGTLDA